MAVPERKGRSTSWLSAGVVVALLAVAALVAGVVFLEVRRRQELAELEERLDTMGRLVDDMQRQMDLHANTSVHAKSPSEPQQEVVYEEEYEYDDEEGTYDYDDEDDGEESHRSTVKRTPRPKESNLSKAEDTRVSKRDISAVREERYVPIPLMNHIEYSQKKLGALKMYASNVGNSLKYVSSTNHKRHLNNSSSKPDVLLERGGQTHGRKSSHHQPHQIPSPDITSAYQEQIGAGESTVRLRHGGRTKHGFKASTEFRSERNREEFLPQHPSTLQYSILAAHYVGDVSSYNDREHSHYFGNNILYHPSGLFQNWVPSDWMSQLANSQFTIHEGKLSVQKPGIYFVYAQIYYAAAHDRCGFHIKHNGKEVAQCMITSYGSNGRMAKRNTCFTAVVLQLKTSDHIWTSEVEGHRNTSFKSSHSFFGLILLKPAHQ